MTMMSELGKDFQASDAEYAAAALLQVTAQKSASCRRKPPQLKFPFKGRARTEREYNAPRFPNDIHQA